VVERTRDSRVEPPGDVCAKNRSPTLEPVAARDARQDRPRAQRDEPAGGALGVHEAQGRALRHDPGPLSGKGVRAPALRAGGVGRCRGEERDRRCQDDGGDVAVVRSDGHVLNVVARTLVAFLSTPHSSLG
jgi:hypothetical protein